MHSAEYLDTLPPLPIKNKEKINIYMSLLACTFCIVHFSFFKFVCVLCNEKTNEMKIQKQKVL